MILSVMKPTQYVSNTGIIETENEFIPCGTGGDPVRREFLKGDVLRDANAVYKRTGDDMHIPDFDNTGTTEYNMYDLVIDGDCIKYISVVANQEVAVQPENYSTYPTESLYFDTWDHRYGRIGEIDPNTNTWSADVQDGSTGKTINHSLFYDTNQNSWTYRHTTEIEYQYDGSPYFDRDVYEYHLTDKTWGTDYVKIIYNGTTVYDDIAPSDIYAYVTGTDGKKYKASGSIKEQSGYEKYYAVVQQQTGVSTDIVDQPVNVYNHSSLDVVEEKAYCYDQNECNINWFPKTIIRRGDVLFIRSNEDMPYETKTEATYQVEPITNLSDINGWGWTYYKPLNKYAPFDGKSYSEVILPGPISFTISSADAHVNTIAVTSLIANKVTIEFFPTDGFGALPPIEIWPNTKRDKDFRLSPGHTTMIAYASRDFQGDVKITFESAGVVHIGSIYLGLSVNAGFTNLSFTNRFQDYSPYEKDQWGNIMYVDGVKRNVYTGTVDVNLSDYDMMNRLIRSIGGNLVILNGSDTENNDIIENEHFFASTMVVGRLKNFALKTKLDKDRLSQMATYSFEIEEEV